LAARTDVPTTKDRNAGLESVKVIIVDEAGDDTDGDIVGQDSNGAISVSVRDFQQVSGLRSV
jgi:hypothetical protein